METARTARIKIDLAQLFEQQVEFFRRRTLGGDNSGRAARLRKKTRAHPPIICRARQIDKGSIGTTVAQGHTDFDPTVETPEPLAHRLRAACGRARSNDDPALTRATQARPEFCRSYL